MSKLVNKKSIAFSLFMFGTLAIMAVLAFNYIWNSQMSEDNPNAPYYGAPGQAVLSLEMQREAAQDTVEIPHHIIEKHQRSQSQIEVEAIIEQLKAEFADSIHSIVFQVSLKSLRTDLIKEYPGDGYDLFEHITRSAFPEMADEILANVALMDQYDEWLVDAFLDLNQMPLLEQQGVIWEKRRELFGALAEEIWAEELSAEEERRIAVNHTIGLLDTAYDMPNSERALMLQNAYDEQYSGTVKDAVFDTKSVLAQVFFGFDAVQRELKELDKETRQEELNNIRRTLGFSEEAIVSMAETDQKWDARWENGYAYMAEREELLAQVDAGELEPALDELREKYFKHEANTIKREEQDLGLFRYERPRYYGRN